MYRQSSSLALKSIILLSVLLLLTLLSTKSVFAQAVISGQAWHDANVNGIVDNGELGLEGVRIELEDDNGEVYETVTAEDGSWSIGPVSGQRARLVYDVSGNALLAGYLPSQAGWSTVRVIELLSPPENIDAGFYNPIEFCSANPAIATTRYASGDPLSADGVEGVSTRDMSSLVTFSYSATGNESEGSYVYPTESALLGDTGSIWGLAWDANDQKLYQSSFLKRHVGLGPLGLGGIYVSDFSLGVATEPFVNLADLGLDVGSIAERGLPADPSQPSVDGPAYPAVGKIGLGGLDVSNDGQTLYVMNLAGRELAVIDTAAKTLSGQFPIPDQACTNGETRPFAVKVNAAGNVYVGAVCTAELEGGTSADLSAHILEFDGVEFSPVISFPLNQFVRGQLNGGLASGEWRPWTDEWIATEGYAVPMLSDIEIDDDGSLIVALMDRTGHMGGLLQAHPTDPNDTSLYNREAGGDVIRICLVEEEYVVEGDAERCPYNQEGGDRGDEFYFGEQFEPNFETSLGGIALLPESGEVAVAVSAPFDYLTAGIRWLDNESGGIRRGYQVNPGNFIFFNGANGLGDVEVICQAPPVQIGSRVWRDLNDNNIFDANDQPLPNVSIDLFNANTGETVATVITDGSGRYGFSSGIGTDANGFAFGVPLVQGTRYILRTAPDQGTISGLDPIEATTADNPLLDSDAELSAQFVQIDFELSPSAGDLNHLDFGFRLRPQPEQNVENGDDLEPQSNVVDSSQDGPAIVQVEPNPTTRTFYGIPVDLNNNTFLAVAGLLTAGICASLIGLFGILGTLFLMRRDRPKVPAESLESKE